MPATVECSFNVTKSKLLVYPALPMPIIVEAKMGPRSEVLTYPALPRPVTVDAKVSGELI
jgi:hypothetical protein